MAVFASGRGSNFEKIIAKTQEGFIPGRVALLISNDPNAGALKIAQSNGVSSEIFLLKDFQNVFEYNSAILSTLKAEKIDYIVLAGYLKLIGEEIISAYENRIINIHPALLPAFGGKGMYGKHVHQAVFESGVKVSGLTVHLVNREFDNGPIVLQKCISIEGVNSPDEIAEKVLKLEHEFFPLAVKLMVEDRLKVIGRRVIITGKDI